MGHFVPFAILTVARRTDHPQSLPDVSVATFLESFTNLLLGDLSSMLNIRPSLCFSLVNTWIPSVRRKKALSRILLGAIPWAVQIKLTKDRVTGEKACTFYFDVSILILHVSGGPTEKKVKKRNEQLSLKACTILRETDKSVGKWKSKGKRLDF